MGSSIHILVNVTLRITYLDSSNQPRIVLDLSTLKILKFIFDSVDLTISQSTDPVPTLKVSEHNS